MTPNLGRLRLLVPGNFGDLRFSREDELKKTLLVKSP